MTGQSDKMYNMDDDVTCSDASGPITIVVYIITRVSNLFTQTAVLEGFDDAFASWTTCGCQGVELYTNIKTENSR